MALPIPTKLDNEQIREFQELYKKHFNIVLTDDETLEEAIKFLQFITIIIDNNRAFTGK
jgi:hypothetical protein